MEFGVDEWNGHHGLYKAQLFSGKLEIADEM